MAAVLRDAAGRVLLAQRGPGQDLAGLWEFPGGKVEPGETALQALDRELHEELGIRILSAEPLIRVPQAYPGKRIVLDVYDVSLYEGQPEGREGQALARAAPERLAEYPMPPADLPIVGVLTAPDRYAISPEPVEAAVFLTQLEHVLSAGIRRVQLRAHDLPAADFAALAREAATRCRTVGAQLLLNGSADLAAELGVGLHLRAAQLMTLRERPLLAAGQAMAASCHNAEELHQAQRLGLDFVVLGPVLPTHSHPGARLLGWEGFAALREQVSLPIYALGGVRPGDIAVARLHGAQGVAGIRALWEGLQSR
ncbi:MAG: Nudix family hydrolase [Arenimonas sp.]|nr:Nudix family hydrolase [Arenimonas sp.]